MPAHNRAVPTRRCDRDTFIIQVQNNLEESTEMNTMTVNCTARQEQPEPKGIHIEPASLTQNQFRHLYQMSPASPAYNVPFVFRITGPLDVDRLKKSLNMIIARHEVFRTTFSDAAEGLTQIITPELMLEVPVRPLPGSHGQADIDKIIQEEIRRPFSLSSGPLIRCLILQPAEQSCILILTFHHIVFDLQTKDLFAREFGLLYEALSCRNRPVMPPPPGQYRHYSRWQTQWADGEECRSALDFWTKELEGISPVLELPADHPRPAIATFEGSTVHFAYDRAFTEKLKHFSRQKVVTSFVTLLTAWAALLYRSTSQSSFAVGVPHTNRRQAGHKDILGCCVNIVPIAADFSGNPSFLEALRRLRQRMLHAHHYQEVPLALLVQETHQRRDPAYNPLFQTGFTLDHPMALALCGLQVESLYYHHGGSQLDLFATFWESDGCLHGFFEYNKALFDRNTVERMAGHFQVLLQAALEDPLQAVLRLPLMSDEEKHLVLQGWNQTAQPYPEQLCLPELFEAQAEKTPDGIAAVFEQETISYCELNARANQLARYLKGLGVGPEKLAGIFVERSLSMLIGLLGILKAGGTYVPLDPMFPKERLTFMLADAGVSVLVTQESLANELQLPAEVQAVCLDEGWPEIAKESGDNLPEKAGPEHSAYVIYTSGSTGVPKGVEITHRALVNFLCSMRDEPGIAADDVLLAVTTLSFDIAGLELYVPLIAGARVVIASHAVAADGIRLRELLESSKATIMQATPITWRMLLAAGWQGTPGLKVLCGGEAFPGDLVEPLLLRSAEVWNMYGPTETTIWSTVYRIGSKEAPLLIGRPIANTSIYILDDHMMPVPIGVIGELYIGGDGLARGYLNRPELTAQRFISYSFKANHQERLYKTGDLARYCHDGNIECLGRSDFQVKIRGYRIELGEIETVLQKHPSVHSTVVAARDAGGGDKRLVAYLICEPAEEQPSAQELRELARVTLPAYMIPSDYVFLDRFPLTPNGKIDRKALPAEDAGDQADVSDVYVPPRNEIESIIASVWQSLLHVKRVGIHDDFFDLGGHSLLAVQLFSRLEKIFHKQLPLATLFEAQTVEKLAAILTCQDWKPSWSSLVPIQPGGSKPLFFCVHGAGGNILLYRDLARHMGADQPFYGLQAKGLDGRQPLNTSIEAMAADYVQEIRELQPSGPYYLGGYCLGGAIAFEMARQLVQQGQTVSLVAMFDTQRQWITNLKFHVKLYQGYQQIAFHMRNFLQADMQGKRLFLLEKANEAGRRIRRHYDIARSQIAYAIKLRVEKPLVLMEKINDNAAIAYQPAPYSGQVTLFCPRTSYAGYNDPLYGWGNGLTAGVDVQQLSSYPAGMLVEPFVAELAEKLKACLENTCAKQGSAAAP